MKKKKDVKKGINVHNNRSNLAELPMLGEIAGSKFTLADIAKRGAARRSPQWISAYHFNDEEERDYVCTTFVEKGIDKAGRFFAVYSLKDPAGVVWKYSISEVGMSILYSKFGIKSFDGLVGTKIRLKAFPSARKKYVNIVKVWKV